MYGNVNMDWLKSWDLSKVPADIVLVLNNIYRKNLFGVDVDLALGELLNAAADNAKELILKKINATGEWTDVWAYALTQGYSIDYIYNVVNDPRLRGAMTTRNIFGGFVQTKKSDILEMFPGSEIANWIKGAEEFSLLSGITKINQGIKTTEFDYLVYSHKFEEGVTKQLFEAANHTETFSMQKFVLDPQYRADMIGLYESKKHTYNILAMFAEHPLFMSMWKAYFVSSMFLQQLSPRETLNMGVISSKRSWYFGQISSDTFKQVSDNLEEKILKRFLKDAEIRKGVTLNISSIQHARNILHKALSKYFSEHKLDNEFTKNIAYTIVVPRFGYEEVAALTPSIDMFEVDKNRNLQLMYAKMLDALQRKNDNIMLVYKDSKDNNRRVKMTLSEALWLYSMLFYKPNAAMSFTRFVEESRLPNSLATAYYDVVNKLANSPKDIEKIANWSQAGEVAIKQFITKHLEEVSEYIRKQRLSTRVVHSGILENIESEYIKVYDETNLREVKKLGFTEEELQGVKAAKAFIYNGVVYINKNSTYADLFHEMIHIKIANLALTGDIAKLQDMYMKWSKL